MEIHSIFQKSFGTDIAKNIIKCVCDCFVISYEIRINNNWG